MIGRGVAYRKMDETDLPRSKWGSCSFGGCGVPQNGTPRDTVHLHRRPPPASTGYCSSIVDLLQPPRAPVHAASTTRYSTGYCSTTPLHGLLFKHTSTGYCSSTPPSSTVHLALHGVVLFIGRVWRTAKQDSTGYCSSPPSTSSSLHGLPSTSSSLQDRKSVV